MNRTDHILNYADRVLTAPRLRGLLRTRRTRLVPEQLVERIRHRAPEIHPPDAEEIGTILEDIASTARAELGAAGIIPVPTFDPASDSGADLPTQRLTARERSHVADMAALLSWASEAASIPARTRISKSRDPEADRRRSSDLSDEAVRWGLVSGDTLQLCHSLSIYAGNATSLETDLSRAQLILRYALGTIRAADSGNYRLIRLHLEYQRAALHDLRGELDMVDSICTQSESIIAPEPDYAERAMRVAFLTLRSGAFRKRSRYTEALQHARLALRWSNPDIDPLAHCKLLQAFGILYSAMEHREQALRMYLEAISILEAHGLAMIGGWVYLNAAQLYGQAGETAAGHEILTRLESVIGDPSSSLPAVANNPLVSLQIARAGLLIRDREYDRAKELLDWCIGQCETISVPSGELPACAMAATVCGHMNDPAGACSYMERAIRASEGASRPHQLKAYTLLATWLIADHRDAEAERLLDEIGPELRSDRSGHIQILRLRAELCERKGKFQDALALEREAAETERDLLESNRERSVRYARILAETTLVERLAEQEREQRRRLEHELAGAMVELSEKRALIEEAKQRLTEQIGGHSKEKRRPNEKSGSVGIQSILSLLDKGVGETASPFAYFGNAGDEFVYRLRESYPRLTSSQERLCMLLRAGLNSTEVCTILEIGSEGLKSRRKRLRKALGLQKGESLERVIGEV